MLTKKQFLERLNFLIDYQNREMEFDEAMRKFAPSDFTGFSDDTTLNFLIHTLEEDMNDDDGYISWWLWDAPDQGRNPEHCIVEDGEDTWQLTTPEQLYGYLAVNYGGVPSKTSIQIAIAAQDNGVKFALKRIQDLIKENKNTHNQDWEDRDTLLKYTKKSIENNYLLKRGIGADLDIDKGFDIFSVLDEDK